MVGFTQVAGPTMTGRQHEKNEKNGFPVNVQSLQRHLATAALGDCRARERWEAPGRCGDDRTPELSGVRFALTDAGKHPKAGDAHVDDLGDDLAAVPLETVAQKLQPPADRRLPGAG